MPSPPAEGPARLRVPVLRLDPDAPLPSYAMPGDAGADLITTRDLHIEPGERALVGTGIAVALPVGYAAFVHPRSGLAARVGLSIVNTPGTVDAGYRGEITLSLINHDPRAAIDLRRGDRVAQLVIQRVEHALFEAVDQLPGSDRGSGGYGSTGGASPLWRSEAGTSEAGISAVGSPGAEAPSEASTSDANGSLRGAG